MRYPHKSFNYDESSNKPSPKCTSEDESLFQTDMKLEDDNQNESFEEHERNLFDFRKVSDDGYHEYHNAGYDFTEGFESIPPRAYQRVLFPSNAKRFGRRNLSRHNTFDRQHDEDGLVTERSPEMIKKPTKLLDESKRRALQAFCDTVKRMEPTLKQPLDVYLRENQGCGFIGKPTPPRIPYEPMDDNAPPLSFSHTQRAKYGYFYERDHFQRRTYAHRSYSPPDMDQDRPALGSDEESHFRRF